MAKAKKSKEKSAAVKLEKKPVAKPKSESAPIVEEKPKEEEKQAEIKAKIEISEKDLIMPCLYKCNCNLTKGGKAFAPGSIVQLTQKQVDQILKGNPEAIEPA